MTDVFLSYAAVDHNKARSLASCLSQAGLTVWWDRDLHGGEDFEDEIEQRLLLAKCVVVLWTQSSRRSNWVKGEARTALRESKLIPVLLENTSQPIDFRSLHAIDLSAWNENAADASFQQLCESIRRIILRATPSSAPSASASSPRRGHDVNQRFSSRPYWMVLCGGAASSAVLAAVILFYSGTRYLKDLDLIANLILIIVAALPGALASAIANRKKVRVAVSALLAVMSPVVIYFLPHKGTTGDWLFTALVASALAMPLGAIFALVYEKLPWRLVRIR